VYLTRFRASSFLSPFTIAILFLKSRAVSLWSLNQLCYPLSRWLCPLPSGGPGLPPVTSPRKGLITRIINVFDFFVFSFEVNLFGPQGTIPFARLHLSSSFPRTALFLPRSLVFRPLAHLIIPNFLKFLPPSGWSHTNGPPVNLPQVGHFCLPPLFQKVLKVLSPGTLHRKVDVESFAFNSSAPSKSPLLPVF